MRLLIVGANSNYAIELPYYKYLKEIIGVGNVQLFEAQNIFLDYYQRSFLNKIIYRLGLSKIVKKINENLKIEIVKFKPDVIWVFKGMEVMPQTILWMKKLGIKVVNYNPDNPFLFTGRGSGNANVRNSIHLYDLHFTYNLEIKKKIEEKYQLPCFWLPFGFDITDSLYEKCVLEKEIGKACFVGNPDAERVSFFKSLADKNIIIDIYGNNWTKFIKHKNVTIYDSVYGDDLWITLRKYRVQLNPLRPHNRNSHGMRSFEVPAIGGIMLAPRTIEHVDFFEEGKEAFFYQNLEEAVSAIQSILFLSASEVEIIRKAARKRSINSGYSYQQKALFVQETISNNIEMIGQ